MRSFLSAVSILARRGLTASLAAAALPLIIGVAASKPARAQNVYLYPGGPDGASYTVNDRTYHNTRFYVGQDSNGNRADPITSQPYIATLNVVNASGVYTVATYNSSTTNISSSGRTDGASGYDTSTTNISSSGYATFAEARNSSTFNIDGGTVSDFYGYDTSTTNISAGGLYYTGSGTLNVRGGSVSNASIFGGTLNVRGGSVTRAIGYQNSRTNISGGTLINGLDLQTSTSTANFIGTGLTYAYRGYGSTNGGYDYADSFTISGLFGGTAQSYELYIDNPSGSSGTANSTPRQFTFNGVAVGAPEPSTLPLLGMGFTIGVGMVGTVKRRKAKAKQAA